MNSPDVVAALRAGGPDAAGQLYEAHAEGLYQYCWLVLRSREKAQVAVRDAIIFADARIAELDDPAMLKAWLFAIARAECDRHCPGSAGESDEPVARPQQRDAALRIMAWNSVISLPAAEREALDLVTRHGMTPPEVARVLGLAGPDTPALLTAAQRHLERALTAEILINRDSQECAGRAEALQGWTGTVTPAVRERVLRHAAPCPACRPRLPRNVSAAKIFGLIPQPAMIEGGWAGVLSRLSDPEPRERGAAAREAVPVIGDAGPRDHPAAAAHEQDPAVTAEHRDAARDATATPDRVNGRGHGLPGYPRAGVPGSRAAQPGTQPGTRPADPPMNRPGPGPHGAVSRGRRRRVLAGTGAVLAAAAAGIAAALAAGGLGGHAALSGDTGHQPAAADAPAQAGAGQAIRRVQNPAAPGSGAERRGRLPRAAAADDAPPGGGPGQLTRATARAMPPVITPARTPQRAMGVALLPGPAAPGSPGSPAPAAARSASASPSVAGQLEVSPGTLDLGTASAGQIVLTASGGPVSWTAIASSPDLTTSQSSGQLSAGQSVTVVVEVWRQDGAGGNATISINSAPAVEVSWDATTSTPPPGRHRPQRRNRPASPGPAAS